MFNIILCCMICLDLHILLCMICHIIFLIKLKIDFTKYNFRFLKKTKIKDKVQKVI